MATVVFEGRRVNVPLLDAQLRAALAEAADGIVYDGGNRLLRVLLKVDDAALARVAEQVVEAHNPDALTPEQAAEAQAAAVKVAAGGKAAAIPGWASWTEDDALDWYETHVTDPLAAAGSLAEAKVVLASMAQAQRALIRMVLALRNEVWPNLEKPKL